MLARGDAASAERVLRQALELDPNSVTALGNLGNALRRQGRVEEASNCYRQALSIRPEHGLRIRLATLLPVIARSRETLEFARQRMEAAIDALLEDQVRIDDPVREVGITNFHLSYHDENNRELNAKVARLYMQACPSLRYVAPHCSRELQLSRTRFPWTQNWLNRSVQGGPEHDR